MSLRTPLGRVRGLGSAKDGVAHWWAQRLTAVALIPLLLWLVASLVTSAGMDHAAAKEWLSSPVSATLLILLIGAGFHHAQLGLQVVIEDYVHTEWLKIASITSVKLAAIALAVSGVFSILKIAFGG
jgi:succinate dehydrogenase / fumarate reductase, membrane anchor subunit